MAAIDKIYGKLAEQREFYQWAEENKPDILRYFYEWSGEWLTDGKNHPITLFPVDVDNWLMEHCPIGWVVDRIKDQYGIEAV